MENNYHFKINQKPPGDEQIAQHIDFDALLKKHQAKKAVPKRKPQVRRLVYWGSAVAAAIAFFVFVLFPTPNPVQESINPTTFFADNSAVTPPLSNHNDEFAFSTSTINANQGGIYEYESGSRLVIPSSAFVDDRGHLVEGEVTIYYREYINTVDFFLAGIPLDYDGKRSILEPNGMVEVFAQQNGKSVFLAPDKNVRVELVGQMILPYTTSTPEYNIYRFDSIQRKWNFVVLDNIQTIDDIAVELDDPVYQLYQSHQSALASISAKEKTAFAAIDNSIPMPIPPIKPQPRDKDRPTLELSFLKDVLDKKGVDQNLYMETIWQIAENSPAYDERAFQVVWDDADIKNINDSDYELTLTSGDNHLKLIVNPVLTSNEFSQALTRYQAKLIDYQQAIKDRETTLVEQKRALNNLYEKERQKEIKTYQKQLTTMTNDRTDSPFLVRKVLNQFVTNHLGIFACATPHLVQEKTLIANFSLGNTKISNTQIAFVHYKNSNVVRRILAQDGTPIHFSPDTPIEIWMIDPDGNLVTSESFTPTSKTKSHTFSLQQKGQVSNRAEVNKYLQEL